MDATNRQDQTPEGWWIEPELIVREEDDDWVLDLDLEDPYAPTRKATRSSLLTRLAVINEALAAEFADALLMLASQGMAKKPALQGSSKALMNMFRDRNLMPGLKRQTLELLLSLLANTAESFVLMTPDGWRIDFDRLDY